MRTAAKSCQFAPVAIRLAAGFMLLQAWHPVAVANDSLFAERIAPLFASRCLGCHNDLDRKGGFSLETAEGFLAAEAVVAGDPAASWLVDLVVSADGAAPAMPKTGAYLTAEEVADLREWIAAGAHWPEGLRIEEPVVNRFDWWSLQPLAKVEVPRVDGDPEAAIWIRNPIDAFVLAGAKKQGLTPSSQADRRTLIRRVTFDLTGLPPSPVEIESFVHDPAPDAWEKLIDRLLASPRYGEHWGRYWLDLVRYADTCGYDKDKLRPNAWPYRDYVIRSFNEDKPYSRFVEEQLAGDVLYPGTADGILGLGFIAAGPWDFIGHVEVPETKKDGLEARNLDRDEMVSATFNVFCSTTVQCARCHHHKFDPVTQQHYYGLQAVFAAVDRADRVYEPAPSGEAGSGKLVHAATTSFTAEGSFQPTNGKPRTVFVLHRGNVAQPLEEAQPGAIPLRAEDEVRFELSPDHVEGDRRAALAHWITRPDNPLTWRSVVNRIWLHHFGRGLVDSPNDFGRMGQAPTHPELLDWLAREFRDGRQSFKDLHRLILTSATWQQASCEDSANSAIDADNRYLWRMPRRRLQAEEIRDAMLAASGSLELTMGGPGDQLFELEKTEHSPHYSYHLFDPAAASAHRRSVYRFVVRSQPDPFVTVLDGADCAQSVPQRDETLTALQALALLNNRFVLVMGERMAERLERDHDGIAAQVGAGFEAVSGRLPSDGELADLVAFAEEHGLPAVARVLFNLNEFVFLD